MAAELSKLRKPDGQLVNPADVSEVNGMISTFFDFIIDDFSKYFDTSITIPNADAPKATQLLISLIVMRYNNGGVASEAAVAKLKARGYYDPAYASVTKFIDAAPKAPLQTLQRMNITFKTT